MGYPWKTKPDLAESDAFKCFPDSSDEEFATADEFSRRSELFATPNKDSFVDHFTSRCQGADEKRDLTVRTEVSDGIARYRMKSLSGLKELTRCKQANSQRDCRFDCFFIRQQNSNSRLSITRELFNELRIEYSIFGRIKEHAMSFGFKVREDDIGPPRCRFRLRTSQDEQADRFECVYGLRYVERSKSKNPLDEWRVRQSAVYQSFIWVTREQGSETWLFISASQAMEEMACKHMRKARKSRRRTPFDLHVSLVRIALSNWRWYIKSLAQRIADQTSRIVAATVGNGPSASVIDFRINFEDQQILKVVEDRVLDLIIIWDSTLDTIEELLRRWQSIKPRIKYQAEPDQIASSLQDCLCEVRIYQGKTKTLLKRVRGTATLLSNLLEYENGKQTQDNGHSLKILAQESRIENVTMRRLTEKSTKDAAAVKAITIITILYLPTTVVAGFFSTQFVFQEQRDSGRPKLSIAENWWVYVAVSAPLTIVTIGVWYAWISYPWKGWRVCRFHSREWNDGEAQRKENSPQNDWVATTRRTDHEELVHHEVRTRDEPSSWPFEAVSAITRTVGHSI